MPDKYRCFVPGGFSSNPFDRTIPVSIGCNNPGAINGAAGEKRHWGRHGGDRTHRLASSRSPSGLSGFPAART